jgi:hypothetical protein
VTAWPWPGDTPLDQARRVAQSYRAELHDVDPDRCAELDERFAAYGQRWVAPTVAHIELDDEVTIDEAADLVGLSAYAVYKWVSRDDKLRARQGADGRLRVVARDVLAVHAQHRKRRARRRRGGAS